VNPRRLFGSAEDRDFPAISQSNARRAHGAMAYLLSFLKAPAKRTAKRHGRVRWSFEDRFAAGSRIIAADEQ